MKKKRSTRLINAGDILLTIICLIGMAVALYLFWNDLNVTLSKQDEAPIAVVYFKKNTVQRRLVDRNLWERVQESALVYEGDRIRTSEMSEAVTVFADGTEIEIHENTLIQVYTQKERAAIDFVSGAITATASGFEGEASASAPLLIKTGNRVVELDAGSAASVAAPVSSSAKAAGQASSADKVAVTVTKGTAAVREAVKDDSYRQKNTASSVTKVAQDSISDFGNTARQVFNTVTAASVPETESPVPDMKVMQAGDVSFVTTAETEAESAVQEKIAVLYLPVSSTTIRLEKDAMPIIQAQWEANASLMFEFARDASFNTMLFTRTYPATQTQAYVSLQDYAENDNIFWRARFADEPDSAFASGVILLQDAPDESVQEMIDRVLNDEEKVPLKDEPDTQEEAIKAEAIRKEEEERKAREEAARLDAERAEQERLAAIKAEEDRIAAEKAEAERIAAEKEAAEKAEAERLAEEARLEAEREAAEKAIAERRLAAAKAAEDKRIAAEKAAAEKAAAEKAAAEKKLQDEIAAAQKAAEEKRIAAARAAEQKAAAEKAAAEKAAREEAERLIAEQKAAEEAAARAAFVEAVPVLRSPANGRTLDDSFFETNRTLQFSWNAVPGAGSYRIIIRQNAGGFVKKIVDQIVTSSSYTMRTLSDLDEGSFEWTVTGRMADGTESKAATGSFSVKLEPLEDIQLDMTDLFRR